MTTTTRRSACVLALVLLFLTIGGGITLTPGTGAHGLKFQMASKAALAQTPVDESNYSEGLLSASTRHKTH